MPAERGGADAPAAAVRYDRECVVDVGARKLDADRVAAAAVIEPDRGRAAEAFVRVGVEDNVARRAQRHVQPILQRLRRAASEYFKITIHGVA